MAKLTILAAALVALLALAQASAYRTTITTTVVEDENPLLSQQRCREQMQRQQQLRHCQMYLSRGRSYDEVAMITDQNQQSEQQHLRQCCEQLENIDEQCRCEAVRMMVRQQQQQGEWQGEEMREVVHKAEDLPNRCNLSPRRCQIRAVWF